MKFQSTLTFLGGIVLKGIVFDIQRFCVHDGPGIRTTVFMKGCPLRCRWCHNPEGFSREIQVQYFKEQCIGCGRCKNVHSLSNANICPSEALKVCGKEMDDKEVFEQILKDRSFYGKDGGITFSGGECLLQADFVVSVLKRAKEAGLHTAIDTSGCVPTEAVKTTLPFCDMYLYDIKCIDPTLHREYTGVDNRQILENVRWLNQQEKPLWIRVPVIPGFNNNEREMTAIANMVSCLSCVEQVTLMPYHTLGSGKYETLGMEYQYDKAKRISESELALFREIFQASGTAIV